jgi:small subunit ribosomal protein S6
MNQYETVFILNPVLSVEEAKEAAKKFRRVLTDLGAQILHEETWGKLKKSTGYYTLIEFVAGPSSVVAELELAYKKDKRVLRFMTVKLDKVVASQTADRKQASAKTTVKKRKTAPGPAAKKSKK